MKKVLTLCLIQKDGQVLLGMKKRGFGLGRWNGFGGKVEEGETIEQAAKREVLEEAGVSINSMEKVGLINFTFDNESVVREVHIFRIHDFQGEPTESEEMKPQWFSAQDVPLDSMWDADRHWFPIFLAGKKFKGRVHFDAEDKVKGYEFGEI
jgi:8-oxo-dGTP pyrophosphatase MutT (NUDIX family)